MRTNKLLQGILLLGVFLVGAVSLSAQQLLDSYINERVGNWAPLENPTEIGRGDDPWASIEMPFSFTYDNQNIHTVYAYGNGFISLNNELSPLGSAVPSFAQRPNLISWYSADLYTTGMMSYKVTGTAPFRVLTVEQLGARTFLDFSGATFDVQIKFFETTNEIQIIFGNTTGIGGRDIVGALYFNGMYSNITYINIKPENPIGPSTFYYWDQNRNTTFWLTKDVRNFLPSGKTYTLSPNPSISDIYPGKDQVLVGGEIYEDDFRPYVRFNRGNSQDEVQVRFRISGPLPVGNPDYKTIYVAVNEEDESASEIVSVDPQPVGNGVIFRMPHAKDIAGRLSDGALDLAANEDEIVGGEYEVTAVLTLVGNPFFEKTYSTTTNIALSDDIAITDMESPSNDFGVTYSISSSVIPVIITVRNQGKNPVTRFKATAKIYKNSSLVEELPAFEFEDEVNPLEIGESMEVQFSDFIPSMSDGVGDFNIICHVELLSALEDKLPANNTYPRTTDDMHIFRIGYEVEAEVAELLNPSNETYVGSPVIPSVRILNNGVADINDASVTIRIVSPSGKVYERTVLVNSIPHGFVNDVVVFFDDNFIPEETGVYDATITINAVGDEIPGNNVLNTTFTVQDGMNGEYHITAEDVDVDPTRVFPTIKEAIDRLYLRGVSGDVTFYLYDEDYQVGDIADNAPALDLTSTIIGVDADNKVYFKPHESVQTSANIHLHSGNGIGVLFGQNINPDNLFAPIQRALEDRKKEFANNNGYIVFDGGTDKQLRFEMHTNTTFRAAFYLANGASNITLKNLQINGGDYPSYDCSLPKYRYNADIGRFTFEDNTYMGESFTTGILLRSLPPVTPGTNNNTLALDTVLNVNNVIDGNEISEFGYGIVSLGIGILRSPATPAFEVFYNSNNLFKNNIISNVAKAGIYLGNEYKSIIKGNRIYNIFGGCGYGTAGIMLGNSTDDNRFGSHNIEITIDGNEISHLSDENEAVAIDIYQQFILFDDLSSVFTFPAMKENIIIKNNLIWGFQDLMSVEGGSQKIGIRIQASDNHSDIYNTENDFIANNTIVIDDDGLFNPGYVVGAYLYHTDNISFYNNAIAVMDESFDWETSVVAAVYYNGLHPLRGGIKSDNNAFYLPDENAQIFRFVEIDGKHRVLETGYNKEFVDLDQWRQWTKQDWSSVEGEFVSDHEYTETMPPTMYIPKEPAPYNSILNLRGKTLSEVQFDIRNDARGVTNELYNIGAYEFNGRMADRDIEFVAVIEPGAYKATPPMPFSDVEYVMLENPEYFGRKVSIMIRNNSKMAVGGVPVTMKEWRQSYPLDSTDAEFVVEDSLTVNVERLEPGEERLIVFDDEKFLPKTYAEFRSPGQPYIIPDEYKPLEANVSPIYKYSFHLNNDEIMDNNSMEKLFRFFIQKSNVSLLLSVRGINENIMPDSNTVNEIATNLNLDSLVSGFFDIGWFVDIEREDPVINIDIFDRSVWEPRSVKYPLYRTLFWVEGHDIDDEGNPSVFERYERLNIRAFLQSGRIGAKKNFVTGSQELVRNSVNDDINYDFINMYLRTINLAPGNPLGANQNYAGHNVVGTNVGRNTLNMVKETGFDTDDYPKPGLVKTYTDDNTTGSSRIGFVYQDADGHDPELGLEVPESDRTASIATTTLEYNVIHLGVDWRHWADIETVLRAILDFLENNDGNVIPVELIDFSAQAVGDRVEVTWKTASEYNSSHFELERAYVVGEEFGNFFMFDNIQAAGNSSVTKSYGPFVDWSVASGNTYAYRLKSVDKDGEFSYNEPVIVTLDGVNDISISEAKPNPVTDNSTITYKLNNTANVFIAIYDINGNLIANPVNDIKSQGTYELQINAGDFASGKYTMVYRVGNSMMTRSINIVK